MICCERTMEREINEDGEEILLCENCGKRIELKDDDGETEEGVRANLSEALEDYKDSCNRQGIEFDHEEAQRFCKENNHMNLSEEEINHVYSQEE